MAAALKFLAVLMMILYNVVAMVEAPHQHGWCVSDPAASEDELRKNIDYCCDILGEFCAIIKPGGACYISNSIKNHTSVVMNEYFVTSGGNAWNCDFKGTALLTSKDPSFGECKYKVIKSARSDSSRVNLLPLPVAASYVFLLLCVIVV